MRFNNRIGLKDMDLNEILSYKPYKKAGSKRPLGEDREEKTSSVKAPRLKLGATVSKPSGGEIPNPLAPVSRDGVGVDLNGISDEEKLRLLQSIGDEEDDQGISLTELLE